MSKFPDLGIPYVASQQVQPEVTHNEAITMLGAMLNGVISLGGNSPPGGPTAGDAYVVGTSPTGAWSGRANTVAVYTAGGWRFIPDRNDAGTIITMGARHEGLRVFVRDLDAVWYWTGAAWAEFTVAAAIAGHYGMLAITQNSTPLSLTAGTGTLTDNGDYVQITGLFDSVPHGLNFGISQNTNDLQILRDGVYQLALSLDATSDTNDTLLAVKWRVDTGGSPDHYFSSRHVLATVGASGDIVSNSQSTLLSLSAGDTVSVWIAADKTADITIDDLELILHEVRTL